VYVTISDGCRTWHQIRAYRKGTGRYRYRAHEVPVCSRNADYTDIIFDHHQPPERWGWKLEYTLKRLLMDVDENPYDPRPMFYLGRQYMYLGEHEEAIKTLEKYMTMAPTGYDAQEACLAMSTCYEKLEDKSKEMEMIYKTCAVQPRNRWQWYLMASKYHERGANDLAVGALKFALEIKNEIGYKRTNEADIHDLLARCLWKLQRFDEGKQHAEKAVELRPNDARLQKNAMWFRSATGDMDAFYELHGENIHTEQVRHEEIAKHVHGKKILDVGCGTGDLLKILEGDLHGSEISKVAIEMTKKRGIKATFHHTDTIPDGPWDTIIMSQVLEHVENDVEMITNARQQLAEDGILLISVPKKGHLVCKEHINEYSEERLKKITGGTILDWSDEHRTLVVTHGI